MHQFNTRRALNRQKTADGSPRSLSPNNILVDNGKEAGKEPPSELKKMLLENIAEETDPLLPELEMDEELSGIIKKVDRNVQKFIKKIASKSNCLDDRDAKKDLETICRHSQEELKYLTTFLSTMGENARDEVVEVLVKLFKNEIMDSMDPQETKQKIAIFKDACKGLISDYKSRNGSSSIKCNEGGSAVKTKTDSATTNCNKRSCPPSRVHFDESWRQYKVVNEGLRSLGTKLRNINQEKGLVKQKCAEKYQREIEKCARRNSARSFGEFPEDKLKKPKAENPFRIDVFDKRPNRRIAKKTFKENALEDLLGSNIKKPTAVSDHIFKSHAKASSSEDPLKLRSHPQQRVSSSKLGVRELSPEGIRTEFFSKDCDYQTPAAEYVEPSRFQIPENGSEIVINRPSGCQLKLQKSKSHSHIEDEVSGKRSREKGNKSVPVEVVKNCPFGEVERNQSINFLSQCTKKGDSPDHFSEILFDPSHQNSDKNISSWETPALSQSLITNYLSLDHLSVRASESSITEEEYRAWLWKRSNWGRYSVIDGKGKNENYETVWGSSLEKEPKDVLQPHSSLSDWALNYILTFGGLFLYEHVVISRAINLFLTFNTKKARALNKWNRCVQISCLLVLFCTIWYFFCYYAYAEPPVKKAARFWE